MCIRDRISANRRSKRVAGAGTARSRRVETRAAVDGLPISPTPADADSNVRSKLSIRQCGLDHKPGSLSRTQPSFLPFLAASSAYPSQSKASRQPVLVVRSKRNQRAFSISVRSNAGIMLQLCENSPSRRFQFESKGVRRLQGASARQEREDLVPSVERSQTKKRACSDLRQASHFCPQRG